MMPPTAPSLIEVRALAGPEIAAHLDEVAALRAAVFRDWPYLYDSQHEYERQYIASYIDHPGAVLIAAFDPAGQIVGASTSVPMEDQSPELAAPFAALGVAVEQIIYGPESVLLLPYRGQGIGHRFFDLREAHARSLQRSHVAFCSVLRPLTHPARPPHARSNDAFWQGRGYVALPEAGVEFAWKDIGDLTETAKRLQFWIRAL